MNIMQVCQTTFQSIKHLGQEFAENSQEIEFRNAHQIGEIRKRH